MGDAVPPESPVQHPIRELSGQVAVVTGSSSGIGRAMAVELAAAGADVLVHGCTNRLGAQATVEQAKSLGVRSQCLFADLGNPEQRDTFAQAAWEWSGKVDIWVNNAGADVLTGSAARESFDEKLTRLWHVDVLGTMNLSRAIGDRMKQRGSGVVINMGWDQAEWGMAGDSGEMFAAIKGAVMAFTRSLAHSLAPAVRVNGVAPGWIQTAWGDQASAYWRQRACRESLLERWGTPEDVARVVRFLASPAAAFVTGQFVPVNGGCRRGEATAAGT